VNESAKRDERAGRDDEHREPEQPADEAGHERDAERLAAAPLPVHLEAVDHRRRGCVGARRADQDGGDRAAVLGADVDRGEHHDRGDRIEAVGEGKKQRHRDRRRDPRQRTADDSPRDTDKGGGNRPARRKRLPGEGELGHRHQMPGGIATPSIFANTSQSSAAQPIAYTKTPGRGRSP
jgi:hypothetical protein